MGKGPAGIGPDLTTEAASIPGEPVSTPLALHIALGVLIALCVLVGAFVLAHALYQQDLDEQRRDLRNLAVTLADQTDRTLQILDIVQRSAMEELDTAELASPQQFDELMGREDVHHMLSERLAGLPYVSAISLVNSKGQLINTSGTWPTPAANVSQRNYFIALSSMKGAPTFVTSPLYSLITQRPTIFLARRIATPDGVFLGLVVLAIEQTTLEAHFASPELVHTGLIALVRDDGALLARAPNNAAHTVPDPPARASLAQALTTAEANGQLPAGTLDFQPRIAAVQPLAHFPLVVVVSEGARQLVWHATLAALPTLAAAVLVCVLIALVILLLIRQLQRARAFSALEHGRARRDPLTGLPNRLAFTERLNARLAAPPLLPAGPPLALLLLDLDYFKTVNDTLGHDVGDGLLRAVAERLRRNLGQEAFIARLGGDEFAIIGAVDEADAHALAHRAISAIGTPFVVDQHQVISGCSVGIAMAGRDGGDVASLLKAADLALYVAKSEGRGATQTFRDEMSTQARARRELELDLHLGWEEHQFAVAYQPIFETTSGALAGFEALLRWRHPTRGEVPPESFIPVAEECGLILNLGGWVLQQACAAATRWPAPLFVSVNVSPAQFRGGHAGEQVYAALAASALPPDRLELEITESLLLNADGATRALLDRFRADQISLALDDFGTGYSSLRYLRMLKIARLKIDHSFIAQIEEDPHMRAIVIAILSLAKAMSLKTTAEGVERPAQLALLTQEGCTHLQGYLLGEPMSHDEACRLARTVSRVAPSPVITA